MRKVALFILAIAVLVSAQDNADGKIDITADFTDSIFRSAVYKKIGKKHPAPIYDTDVNEIKIFADNNRPFGEKQKKQVILANKGISSLNGIEHFAALTELYIDSNQIEALDISKNEKLEHLFARGCQLASLDVSKNPDLTKIFVSGNQLSSLNVSKNPNLYQLDVSGNKIGALDISKNERLEELNVSGNQLSALDISKNEKLREINAENNYLASLDVSKCQDLLYTHIYLEGNFIASESDIIGLDKLIRLHKVYIGSPTGPKQQSFKLGYQRSK